MKLLKLIFTLFFSSTCFSIMAQSVSVKWELSDKNNLASSTISGDASATSLVTNSFTLGSKLSINSTLTSSGADTGYTAVSYDPSFTSFTPSAQVTSATAEHTLTFDVTPAEGHSMKVTKFSLDACKVGTDGGGLIVKYKIDGGTETTLESISPLRNKIMSGNSTGYSSHEITIPDLCTDKKISFIIYVTGVATNKAIALRNIQVDGAMDEEVYDASHYFTAFTFYGKTSSDTYSRIDIYDLIKSLKNGDNIRYSTTLFDEPSDFISELSSALTADYTPEVTYADHIATVNIKKSGSTEFTFSITFKVTNRKSKGTATPLKRGLMAINLSSSGGSGNLVSWRARATDSHNYKFKLYRGTSAASQTTKLNSGSYIAGKTNFTDTSGSSSSYYKLEVYDDNDNLIETEVSGKTWSNQTYYLTLQGGAPVDPTSAGASYTPNDASYCDMDGDGEYEIVLKWAPSNEKDAASSGVTSPAFYGCYKLDGTRLWILHTGANMFNSAHTTPFIAWDLDGDGYGEFIVKTAPGAIDGEGNYILMDDDDPTENLKSSNGKQDHGSEYLTVFDGTTGAELSTIKYHTAYGDATTSQWGDEKQNRSERYLAAIGWLDGEGSNPSAIFARGYYASAFVGAYDWDGTELKLRWLSKNTTSGQGLYGEGAHWISVGDCNGDGKQDIVYGSAALKNNGDLLYRTGLGHGDALHLGEFDPDHDGLEVFMVHEKSPYGMDLRDAKTGSIILHNTASSDTGRGLIAHFDPESEGSFWQYSASSSLFDWKNDTIMATVSHGGGASLNNRIYWNGDLADDFFDKSVLEYYNTSSNGFWRMQVNGGNYTIGTLNNSTKYNPCVLGDLLGDWREEIVTWTGDATSGYQLIINATSYATDYTLPHLMDDANYRAQVINQNCAYNQPPHLSYNPIVEKTLKRVPAIHSDNVASSLGKDWDFMYTTYPVIIPDGVKAWYITGKDDNVDTVKVKQLATGSVVPACRAILYCTDNADGVKFRPTTKTATSISNLYGKGNYYDATLEESATTGYYELRDGDNGLGFYRANGKQIAGGTGFISFTSEKDFYALGVSFGTPAAINNVMTNDTSKADIYNLSGQRVDANYHGIVIRDGSKFIMK